MKLLASLSVAVTVLVSLIECSNASSSSPKSEDLNERLRQLLHRMHLNDEEKKNNSSSSSSLSSSSNTSSLSTPASSIKDPRFNRKRPSLPGPLTSGSTSSSGPGQNFLLTGSNSSFDTRASITSSQFDSKKPIKPPGSGRLSLGSTGNSSPFSLSPGGSLNLLSTQSGSLTSKPQTRKPTASTGPFVNTFSSSTPSSSFSLFEPRYASTESCLYDTTGRPFSSPSTGSFSSPGLQRQQSGSMITSIQQLGQGGNKSPGHFSDGKTTVITSVTDRAFDKKPPVFTPFIPPDLQKWSTRVTGTKGGPFTLPSSSLYSISEIKLPVTGITEPKWHPFLYIPTPSLYALNTFNFVNHEALVIDVMRSSGDNRNRLLLLDNDVPVMATNDAGWGRVLILPGIHILKLVVDPDSIMIPLTFSPPSYVPPITGYIKASTLTTRNLDSRFVLVADGFASIYANSVERYFQGRLARLKTSEIANMFYKLRIGLVGISTVPRYIRVGEPINDYVPSTFVPGWSLGSTGGLGELSSPLSTSYGPGEGTYDYVWVLDTFDGQVKRFYPSNVDPVMFLIDRSPMMQGFFI